MLMLIHRNIWTQLPSLESPPSVVSGRNYIQGYDACKAGDIHRWRKNGVVALVEANAADVDVDAHTDVDIDVIVCHTLNGLSY